MADILKKIEKDGLKNLYLFYGTENYLIDYYIDAMKKKFVNQNFLDMNFNIFNGNVFEIIDCAKLLPFMSEHRLILIKESDFFYTGKKNEVEIILKSMPDFCETNILVFVEKKIDKRNKLYKKICDVGEIFEIKSPSKKELIKWIIKIFKRDGKEILPDDAELILKNVGSDMYFLKNEIEKLIGYKNDSDKITRDDINLMCSKNIETKIFDLVFHMGNKNLELALEDYNNLIFLKEQPFMILFMIARQFIFILQAKIFYESGKDINSIANLLNTRSFIVSDCLKQGKNFSCDKLICGIKECREIDFKIKTGQTLDKIAVENLIIKYSA